MGVTHCVCKPLQTRRVRAQRVSGWPFDLVLSGRADDFVCEVEKPVEAEPLTVPDPDAAVPEGIAEVLEDVVRRLARLAPRARVRARHVHAYARGLKRGFWNTCIPVYV